MQLGLCCLLSNIFSVAEPDGECVNICFVCILIVVHKINHLYFNRSPMFWEALWKRLASGDTSDLSSSNGVDCVQETDEGIILCIED